MAQWIVLLVQSLEYNGLNVCGLWESICCTFVCVFKTWLAGFQDYAGKHLNFDVQSHWVIHCTVKYECVCGGWRPASVMGWIKVMPIQVLRMKQMHSTCLWCLGVCMCFWITPKMWIVEENRRRRGGGQWPGKKKWCHKHPCTPIHTHTHTPFSICLKKHFCLARM